MEWPYVVALIVVLAVSLGLVRRLDRPSGRWGRRVRSRLVLGIPWGTLVSVGLVLVVYLLVQDGRTNLYDPVRYPFQAWSYRYVTGWLFSGFAHSGYNHLVNNLTATLVLGSLAEFAFSHYPQRRGAISFGRWRDNPFVRAFAIFPLGVVGVGILTGLFSLGPVIGFSGVVFALAGFALVRFPLTTVLGVFAIQAVRRLFFATRRPLVTSGIDAPPPSPPWWAEVAIQAHALGLLIGIALGIYLLRRRDIDLPAWRIWTAVFLFGVVQSLWAVYWFEGTDRFLLLQGVGVILVVLLATLVAAVVASPDRPLGLGLTARQLATGLLVMNLVLIAVPAVPVNLLAADTDVAEAHPGIEVADYRVIYGENVTNRMVAVVDLDLGGLQEVRTSGVIVVSEERDIWVTAVSRQRLRSDGRTSVTIGGVGWRETVTAEWDAWNVVGNDSVYQVWLEHGDERTHAFASEARRSRPVVANHSVTLLIEDATFHAAIERDGERLETVPVPAVNESVTVGAIELHNEDGELVVHHDGTSVTVASRD
ncbi:MAG: rhomboid family intramembrane serine protease [Halobacteriota archaeon]